VAWIEREATDLLESAQSAHVRAAAHRVASVPRREESAARCAETEMRAPNQARARGSAEGASVRLETRS